MAQQLPRLMLLVMFLSIVGVGYVVKTNQATVSFSAESYTGTTFELS